MKSGKYEIRPGEVSPRVALLQKSLAALGAAVAPDEVESCTLGKDTEAKLREIQSRAGIDREDRPPADPATQHAINAKLKESGLAENKRSFTVSGTVTDVSGQPVPGLQVLAYDVDLRGIRVRREAETVSELKPSDGFDVLGEDVTDPRGAYSITFYDWHVGRAERGAADVVTFGVEEKKRIVARSRIVRTEDYVDDSFVRDLDLVVVAPDDDRTEYERLRSLLDPFLRESKVKLESLTGADEEIAFTASELRVEAAQVATVTDATELVRALAGPAVRSKRGREGGGGGGGRDKPRRAAAGDKPPKGDGDVELAYGLAREGVPLKWSAIARRSAAEITAAIKEAAETRTIAKMDGETVGAFVEKLRAAAAGYALDEEIPGGATIGELLAPVLPEAKLRQAYAQAVSTFEGDSPAEFWTQHLPAQEAFKGQAELVAGVEVAMQLNAISGGHQPLVEALVVDKEVRSVDDLLALSRDDWREAVARAGVPDQPEADEQEQAQFAEFLASTIDAAYPTRRVAQLVADKRVRIPDEQVAAGVSAVLTSSDGFDIATSRVTDFEDLIEEHAGERAPEVASELKTLQRIFQVSTSPSVMEALHERSLDSAHSIVSIPRKSFVATYGDALGGVETAFAVHQRAAHVAGRAEMAAAKLMEIVREDAPFTVLGGEERSAAIEFLSGVLPSYTQLVGGLSMCECRDCSSVFSPSAYLVELLRFLWRGEPNDDGNTPLDIFNQRRPDVVHLPLTCENAKTILPYVDLANEVMERYIASGSLNGFTGYDTGDATEAELRAHPQNSDVEAYRTLSEADYPFTLPYHQPLDVIRAYSDQLGASRYDVMRALHPEPDTEETRAIAAEALRFSPEEYALLTDEKFDGTASATPLHEAYGYAAAGDLRPARRARADGALGRELPAARRSGQDAVREPAPAHARPARGSRRGGLDPARRLLRQAEGHPEGTLNPATDADITAALGTYNDRRPTELTAEQLGSWVGATTSTTSARW